VLEAKDPVSASDLGAGGAASLSTPAPTTGPVIVDALAARTGGTAYAAIQLAHRMVEQPIAQVIVVARKGSLVARGIHQRPGLRLVELPRAKRFELARRLAWQTFGLTKLARRETASTVLTWSGMLPRDVEVRVVCYLANPVMFTRGGAANNLRRWAVRRTVHRAVHVLVPTTAMAELVGETLGKRPDVVPFGIDHTRFRPATESGTDLLCVADFYRHKRHDLLLKGWAELPAPRPRLRLIGDPRVDRSWYRELTAQVAQHSRLGEITFESGLSLDRLVDAYRSARVFALASEHESFCLALLEAQACGVPAVARDSAALRETGGKGTAYVAGDDPRAWAEALQRLLADDVAHAAARAAGLEHARSFSWDRTAAAVRARLLPGRSAR
jgi:glycosyltransferase involved in cell wall biosynthesis